jgi:F0F1-type ATP synthase assembly protein I
MRNLTTWQALAFATELGIGFAAAVLLGLFLGHVADDWLGNGVPVLTLLGSLVGLAAGVYSSAHIAQFLSRPGKE